MSFGSRTPSGLLAILLVASLPLAAAELPAVPTSSLPAVPGSPLGADGTLHIDEGPLTLRGPATAPTLLVIDGSDGAPAVHYTVDAEGRARLDVAGENAVTDATFVRLEGDPTGDAFRLVLRDAEGGVHAVEVDRAALLAQAAAAGAPTDALQAPVAIERPLDWPGAPQRSYLLHVRDSARNQLGAAQLDGTPFLQKGGTHKATLQIPLDENEWDRWFLTAKREGQTQTLNASFQLSHRTDDALILAATFAPVLLGPAEGERILLSITHEKRLTPLVVTRYAEPATHAYRVDGVGPTLSLQAPATSSDFRFTVSWSGTDGLSGMGPYVVQYRTGAGSAWTPWVTTTESSGVFSGDWGRTYEFRARAHDRVGNPSAEALAAVQVVEKPAGEDDVNDPPTARILTPRAGSQVAGLVPITWSATDPDNTRLAIRLELSDDEGETWRLLYAGADSATTWDTLQEAEGPGYRLRLTVSDGTQSASDVVSALTVRNVVAALTPAPSGEGASPAPTGASGSPAGTQPRVGDADEPVKPAGASEEGGKKRVPAPFAGLAILAAAALLAARRRA
ncbi:MAG TPA: hypothetical protein VFH78_07320 [Candidatus Thermoplasmatota archaeon]|nr:hypothetical protein [Candidatus Thermoplasmatota archaeon]